MHEEMPPISETDPFGPYRATIDGDHCFYAGLPGYPRNFSRDTILAGLIACDRELLTSQIVFSAARQGGKDDPITGEESGKIHHEYPGFELRSPYFTTYNACDTAGLFMLGLAAWQKLDPQRDLATEFSANIEAAAGYIIRHLKDGLFWEYPPAGAPQFSLRITYWKDSVLPQPGKNEPVYPVTYALAHFQSAAGLLAASQLLNRPDWRQTASAMFETGIERFMNKETFCPLEDGAGRLEQSSSDELHSLAYIPTTYRERLPLEAIQRRATELITAAGIACTPKTISDQLDDQYHGYVVWMFEQALIHDGCRKFGLTDLAEITTRCVPHIGAGQELVSIEPTIEPKGNHLQLWSVAAKLYFAKDFTTDQPGLFDVIEA